jgi:hypothetical protein
MLNTYIWVKIKPAVSKILKMLLLYKVFHLLRHLFKTLQNNSNKKVKEEKRYQEEVCEKEYNACRTVPATIGLHTISDIRIIVKFAFSALEDY